VRFESFLVPVIMVQEYLRLSWRFTMVKEVERRASDLRGELDYAHATLSANNKEHAASRSAQAEEIFSLRAELIEIRKRTERQEQAARFELATAREDAATLRGKLEMISTQNVVTNTRSRSFRRRNGNAAMSIRQMGRKQLVDRKKQSAVTSYLSKYQPRTRLERRSSPLPRQL
jgi:hypothetical protein